MIRRIVGDVFEMDGFGDGWTGGWLGCVYGGHEGLVFSAFERKSLVAAVREAAGGSDA